MQRHARSSALLYTAALLLSTALLLCSVSRSQDGPGGQESVKDALGTMSRVVADSERLIAARRYDRLPRETSEFEAGLTALERSVGNRPSELRSRLEPLIAKARVASSAMSEAAQSGRETMLPLAHRQLADAVSAIIAAFPPAMRPDGARQ